MKKVISVIFAVVIALSFSVVSFAEERTISFFNDEFEITVPEGFYAAWKEMPEDDVFIKDYETTKEDVLKALGDNALVICAPDKDYEVYIEIYETEYIGYKSSSPEEFEAYLSTFEDYFAGYDIELLSVKEEVIGDIRYAKSVCNYMEKNESLVEYETIYNGFDISAVLYNLGPMTDEAENFMDSLMKSLVYKKGTVNREPYDHTFASGLKATVPGEWVIIEDVEDSVMLQLERDTYNIILYSNEDIWATEYTEAEKDYIKRSECSGELLENIEDFRVFDTEEFKQIFSSMGITVEEFEEEIIKIGDRTVVNATGSADETSVGYIEFSMIMDVEMGIAHIYILMCDNMEEYFDAFTSFIESATYPEIPDEGGEKAETVSKTAALLTAILTGVMHAALFGFIFWVIKKVIKKIKGKNKKEVIPEPNEEKQESEQQKRFCKECGAQIDEENKFCPLCGAKIK